MKIKTIAISGVIGFMCLGMGATAIAGDKGMAHSMADYNKDGKVSHEEMMTHCEMSFMKMDKNSDKKIDSSEWLDEWFLDQ